MEVQLVSRVVEARHSDQDVLSFLFKILFLASIFLQSS